MGYRTVCNVPRVSTYAQAKQIHDDTKPIRGRSVDKRPLGQRRDADNYWVRMDGENGENVEFMVYGTACITWRPDGTVALYTGGWHSQTTHQFFERVLGVGARGFNGGSLIGVNGKGYISSSSLIIERTTTEEYMFSGSRNWRYVEGAVTQYSNKLNRAAANGVRARHKEFAAYLKGLVKLRAEAYTPQYSETSLHTLRLSEQEVEFGTGRGTPRHLLSGFKALITSNQPEDTKLENFYMGALRVLLSLKSNMIRGQEGRVVYLAGLNKELNEVLLEAHADEVIVRTELPLGEVSRTPYDKWV